MPTGYPALGQKTDVSGAATAAIAAAVAAEVVDDAAVRVAIEAEITAAAAGKENTGVAAALVDDLSGVTNVPAARTKLNLNTANHIADPTGGSTVDTEARAAIVAILAALDLSDLMAP